MTSRASLPGAESRRDAEDVAERRETGLEVKTARLGKRSRRSEIIQIEAWSVRELRDRSWNDGGRCDL